MTVIGTVDLRGFDQGVVEAVGGELINFVKDGAQREAYAVSVENLYSDVPDFGDKVPITVVFPDEVYHPHVYPCFVVRRNSLDPAFDRAPWYGWVGRKETDDAEEVYVHGIKGYTHYKRQWRPTPFNINYDVQYFSRDRGDSLFMMLHTLRRLKPPSFIIKVVDSIGDIRNYDGEELSHGDNSDLADIDDRTISQMFSFYVRGELDLDDDAVFRSFTGASALNENDPLYSRHDVNLRMSVKTG